MNQLDKLLDPKLFKAFMAAADTENFTQAAAVANMTQSGVSQHIAKLEERVKAPLFKRIGKTVKLTASGKKLQQYIEETSLSAEHFFDAVRDEQSRLTGLVSYAMPPSCLLSPHFPMLLEERKEHPDIELKVFLQPSPRVIEMVAEAQVDFGFVTQKTKHPLLKQKAFCEEEYILVSHSKENLKKITLEGLSLEKFVQYPGSDAYYNYWLKHNFKKVQNLDAMCLPRAGWIDNIDGAIKMVEGHVGFAVFPRHCVMEQLAAGTLFEYMGKAGPLMNAIYITQLKDHTYPRRVEQVIDWFMAMSH